MLLGVWPIFRDAGAGQRVCRGGIATAQGSTAAFTSSAFIAGAGRRLTFSFCCQSVFRMIEPRVLKGFRDYLPEIMIPREQLIATAQRVYRTYGFSPIDT